jgi:hypothetical protein
MTNAEIERRILDQAYDSAERTAAAAGGAEEALGDVIAEARDLREKIASGAVSPTTPDARWLRCDSVTGRSPLTSRPSRSCTRAP